MISESPTPIAEAHLIEEISPVLQETVEKMDLRNADGPNWEEVSRTFLTNLRQKGYLLVEYDRDEGFDKSVENSDS